MSKIYKILIALVLFGFALIPVKNYAQSIKDSLLFALSITTSEYNKADILLKIATEEFKEKKYTQAQKNVLEAVKISKANNLELFVAESYYLLGKVFFIQKDIENSIDYYTRSVNIFSKNRNYKKLINLNNNIAEVYQYLGAYSKVADFFGNCYAFADSINDDKSKIKYLEKTADAFYINEDYIEAEKHYLELYNELLTKNESKYKHIKGAYKLSETYKKLGQYEQALGYNSKIYALYSEMKDTATMSIVSNNIGYLYLNLNNYEGALESFRNSLQLGMKAKMEDEEYPKLYSNIAICHQNLGNYDNTIIYLKLALELLEDSENYYDIARLENILATIYFKENDLYNAELYSKNSIVQAKKSGDKNLLQTCYYTYSQILREGNDHIRALEEYEKYLSLRDSLLFEQRVKEQELAQRIYNLEKTEKELKLKLADEEVKDLALKQLQLEAEKRENELQLLISEKDLEQSEKHRLQQSMLLSQQMHEAEIRERELREMEQEKEYQTLLLKQEEAVKKEQQKEIELQRLEIEKQDEARKRERIMFGLLTIIGILILIGLILTRKKNKILAKQKVEIEHKNQDLEQKNEEILTQSERIVQQKDLIEKKNEEITDSIHYASRIQNAVLPAIEVMGDYLSEHFIYFRPKDIVSGDFYWAAEKNDKLIVTAVDCTGHGVPGAFMSMLGMSFLNEIVLKENILDADKILNQLRYEIIKSLKQSGKDDEAKDGMDMALCVIDKKNKKLQFSGANNPMYFIRNGELEKIKSDRMPISIHFRSDSMFSREEFDLLKNDTIYIFSDGYADQFGGESGRKLKYKPFQDLLYNMHKDPMKTQQEKLDRFFEEWKGNREQIDDVLVIGLRI